MLGIDARCRIDLEGIVVMRRILEKTVERIEHFVRKEEKELPRVVLSKYGYNKWERLYLESPP